MQQPEALTELAAVGLDVPRSIVVSPGDTRVDVPQSADDWYYCRSYFGGSKHTLTVNGAELMRVLRAHTPAAETSAAWLLQPLLDVSIGGAAFVSDQLRYAEAARGATVGLLRRGELRLAVYEAPAPSSHESAQEHAFRYRDGALTAERVNQSGSDDLRRATRTLLSTILTTPLQGLFEWAWHRDGPLLFDYKPIETTGSLERYLAPEGPAWPQPGFGAAHVPLPDLEALRDALGPGPVVVERGARLSHAVTYRCRSSGGRVVFKGW